MTWETFDRVMVVAVVALLAFLNVTARDIDIHTSQINARLAVMTALLPGPKS